MVKQDFIAQIEGMIKSHSNIKIDCERKTLIKEAVENKNCVVTENGTLATWTPSHSTGRSPKDTYIVCNPESQDRIDWTSPNNIKLDPETFDIVIEDAIEVLASK